MKQGGVTEVALTYVCIHGLLLLLLFTGIEFSLDGSSHSNK